LSAVARTGQRWGLSYIVDFLRGSQSKTIRDEHKNLKTYGVGADISKNNWFDYFKDLIAQGYLAQTEGQFPTIVLTEKSEAVLLGRETVELYKVTIKEDKKSSLVSNVEHPYLKDLFDDLRNVRTAFARSENVPPYVIFSDATLIEMATYLPQNESEMRRISGVGDLKMQKYAADFLEKIKDYCQNNRLESRIDLKSPKRERKIRAKRDERGNDTYEATLDMFKSGLAIEEIAEARELAKSTIESHLVRFVQTGEIMLDDLVHERKIEPIKEAIKRVNPVSPSRRLKNFSAKNTVTPKSARFWRRCSKYNLLLF
jgi:ATP-dependent DNA helicase RecQ